MLSGCDLFSGIGGAGIALAEWVRPSLYCEIDPYCRGVLMSRMADGRIPAAPVFHDVRDLAVDQGRVDIITGGFPCQDISVAGNGAGLAGKRSGLVFEIFRIIGEARPAFVFLENVPAIRTRGAERVVKELAALGYDCRWDCLSAFDVGAPHKRERWWLLAHRDGRGREGLAAPRLHGGRESRDDAHRLRDDFPDTGGEQLRDEQGRRSGAYRGSATELGDDGAAGALADTDLSGLEEREPRESRECTAPLGGRWWAAEPDVGRVAHGVPKRVDRLRGLGNAWVPAQAQEAFRRLMGIA